MGPRNFVIGRWHDSRTIRLLNLADAVIFQSEYQRQFFVEAGYRNPEFSVIHNGADARFWRENVEPLPLGDELRLVSVTTSPRETKRHDIVAAMSKVPGVIVEHAGAWPEGLAAGNVRRLGTLTPEQIAAVYLRSHYLLHPAIKDPCPNSVFESVCAGLPVIYNAGPGSGTEIAGPCGIALDEHDPAGTIRRAREALPALRAAVLVNRPRYTIDRAAAAYRAVFERLGSK
jgi:glycosyltransferase involved in cell wall biosynthesis